MTYGIAMPIVYPITLLAFVNFYVCEKLYLVHFYKKPPSLDQKISKRATSLLTYYPGVLCISFAVWILGNQKMFTNNISPIDNLFHTADPKHHLFKFWLNPMPSWMGLVCLLIFILLRPTFSYCFNYCFKYAHVIEKLDEMELKLNPYFSALEGLD